MKESTKRIILSICAVSVSAVLVSSTAFATGRRSQPGDTSTTTSSSVTTTSSGEEDVTSSVDNIDSVEESSSNNAVQETAASSNVVVNDTASNITSQTSAQTSNNKYLSKMGGFLWFVLSVIVNFIISCWIGNRFYKLSRKSAQSSAEIRALRKDIEEKFASTLHDISEPALEVVNSNDNYARTDEGISMPNRQPKVEITDEEREILRKWDSQQSRHEENVNYDDREDDDYDESYSRSFKSYQPTRSSSGIVFEDDEEQEVKTDRAEPRKKTLDVSGAKKKAKNFINNIFPFDE